jgi:fatty acid desaturase
MKATTALVLINIAGMALTGFLIWYFHNGWWILLLLVTFGGSVTSKKE